MSNDFSLGDFMSAERVARLVSQARRATRPWIELDADTMRSSYNRTPFLLSHRLAEHPQFELAPLFALCRRLGSAQVSCRVGKIPVDAEFDSSLQAFSRGLSIDESIACFENRHDYIAIYNPERDPEYRPVIEGLLGEIAVHTEAVEPGLNWYSTYLFISTEGAITPYHMDREMNFLLQVRGHKTVKLWDPFDPEIMSSEQRDRLLSHDGARPTYKPSFESKAQTFELAPGLGVHHPFIAPHLVHTGPELSISLAITFRTRRSDIWTEAHQFNHRLRSLGIEPRAVGHHPVLDQAKQALLHAARRTTKALRGRAQAA